MSNKMELSLDEILKTSKKSGGRGRGGRRSNVGRPATTAAPVGGVAKSTRQNKPAKSTPAAPAATLGGETKIMVSNLPQDIEQGQLQDYFVSTGLGRPKKILMQYGPNGRSLGSATIIWNKHDQAVKATSTLNGVKIDNRPVRVEMLVSAANLPPATSGPKLADRVTQPKKDKPKPATVEKTAAAGGRGDKKTRGRGRGRGGREPRPKKKTVEELDAEMADYFPNGEGNVDTAATTGAPAAAAGDTAMDDEML
ncbi:RNA-binding RNA annealing protein [Coniothyrium glycines]